MPENSNKLSDHQESCPANIQWGLFVGVEAILLWKELKSILRSVGGVEGGTGCSFFSKSILNLEFDPSACDP